MNKCIEMICIKEVADLNINESYKIVSVKSSNLSNETFVGIENEIGDHELYYLNTSKIEDYFLTKEEFRTKRLKELL